jgi:hypothetical protein
MFGIEKENILETKLFSLSYVKFKGKVIIRNIINIQYKYKECN